MASLSSSVTSSVATSSGRRDLNSRNDSSSTSQRPCSHLVTASGYHPPHTCASMSSSAFQHAPASSSSSLTPCIIRSRQRHQTTTTTTTTTTAFLQRPRCVASSQSQAPCKHKRNPSKIHGRLPSAFRVDRSSHEHEHRRRLPVGSTRASQSSHDAETAKESNPKADDGTDTEASLEATGVAGRIGGVEGAEASRGGANGSDPVTDNSRNHVSDLDCVLAGMTVECVMPEYASDRDDWEPTNASTITTKTSSTSSPSSPSSTVSSPIPPSSFSEPQPITITEGGPGGDGQVGAAATRPSAEKQGGGGGRVAGRDEEGSSALAPVPPSSVWDTLLLISPFFFWGSAMVAMKDVLPHAGPMFVASFRLIPAGALLVAFAASQGRPMPKSAVAWGAILLFALVDGTVFQGCLTEGLKRTSAGLGSVIIDSQPLTVALLASLLFGETITATGALGLAMGVVGLMLLEVSPDTLLDFTSLNSSSADESLLAMLPAAAAAAAASATLPSLSSLTEAGSAGAEAVGLFGPAVGLVAADVSADVARSGVLESVTGVVDASDWQLWDSGEWWMLLAAQSMAVGTVMVRWVCRHSDPIMATGWHMILGGIPLVFLSLQQHDPAVSGHIGELTVWDWSSLIYTSVFGSAVSYGVFFYNANKGNLTRLSSLTFLTPAFAAGFGFLFLGETLTPLQLFGASVTLVAIYLVNARPKASSKSSM